MIDVTNRKIWVFREARSGSTAFIGWLSDLVNKTLHSVESTKDIVNDNSLLFHSHNFQMLRELKAEENPIVIRCRRKDKAEQLLSGITYEYTGLANIYSDVPESVIDHFMKVTNNQRITVTVEQVLEYLRNFRSDDELWDEYAPKFVNQTIYYEECADSIDLPVLEVYNIHYAYSGDRGIRKLPDDYKLNFITNYEEVKELVRLFFK